MTPEGHPADLGSLIREMRGRRVMLDTDLAGIYRVQTKALNRAVKRNAARFPEDFCFRLTAEEYGPLRCQTGTSKTEGNGRGGRRHVRFAFGKHGAIKTEVVTVCDRLKGLKYPPVLPSAAESGFSRSQSVTLKTGRGRHIKYAPCAFAEAEAL